MKSFSPVFAATIALILSLVALMMMTSGNVVLAQGNTTAASGNTTAAPSGNTTAAPTTSGNTTSAPTTSGNTTSAPTTSGNTTAAPSGNTTAAPTTAAANTTSAPSGNTTSAPAGNTTSAPAGNTTSAPAGNTTSAPAGNTTSAPSGNTTSAPAGNTTSAPAGNTTSAPSGNTTSAPSGNTTSAPSGNTTMPPRPENTTMPNNSSMPPLPDNTSMAPFPTNNSVPTFPSNNSVPTFPTNNSVPTFPTNNSVPTFPTNNSMPMNSTMAPYNTSAPVPTAAPFACPTANPVQCWDNSCALVEAACPCRGGLARCLTNRLCVANVNNRTLCPCPTGTSQCDDGSCATACTQACSSTQVRCADGTCQSDQSACECPPAQWQNAFINVTILSGGRSFIDVTQSTTIGASLFVWACGAYRGGASGNTAWTFTDNTDSTKSFTVSSSSTVTLSSSNLIAGHSYTATAVTTLTYPVAAASTAPKGSASWSFRATQPDLAVTILGGSEITTSTNGSVRFVASLTRNSVAQSGINVAWACKCFATNSACACPTAITSAFAQATSTAVSISSLSGSTAGSYSITATAGGVASAAQMLTIVAPTATGAVPPTISILNIPTDAQLRGSESFSVFARSDKDGVAWSWKINGAAQSSTTNVLLVSPAGLTSGVTNVITVTGTLNDLSATASITFVRPAPITSVADCTISSTTSTVVGLQSVLTVSTKWNNADSTVQYTYSYIPVSSTDPADETPLTTSSSLSTALTFTAPLRKVAETIKVIVRAQVNGRTVAKSVCSVAVTLPPAVWITAQLVDNASAKVAAAQSSGDFESLLSIARSCATAAGSSTVGTIVKDALQQRSVEALNALNNKVAKTQQEREGTLSVLSSLVSVAAASGSSANTSTIPSSALDLILKVVTPPTSGSDSSSTIDGKRGGKVALDILSTIVNKTSSTDSDKFTQSVKYIAQTVAAQAELGVTSTVSSTDGKLKAVGTSAPGGSAFSLNFTESNITLPGDMNLGDASNKISLAAAVWTDSDSAKKQGGNVDQGKPTISGKSSSCVSSVVDITISKDGQKQTVTGLTTPISIELTANSTDENGQSVDAASLSCYYFDTTQNAWSTTGVTKGSSSNSKTTCKTTHLTQFALFASASSSTTAAPGTNSSAAPATDIVPIAVGVAVGLVVIAVIVIVVVMRNGKNKGTGYAADDLSTGPALVVPTTAPSASPQHQEMHAYHLNAVPHAPAPRREVKKQQTYEDEL